jgi:HSP20 family protein
MANLIRRDNNNREVSRQEGTEQRWDPFRVVDTLLRWDPFRWDNGLVARGGEFSPRFDIKEVKNAYMLKADLPGVRDEDVQVSLNGNLLTVSGKREEEHREEGEQYYALERSYGTFTRSFVLPDGIDGDNIHADLKGGVLTIQIPKRPEAQPKKITLSKSDSGAGAKA